jgi:hypothetical protein
MKRTLIIGSLGGSALLAAAAARLSNMSEGELSDIVASQEPPAPIIYMPEATTGTAFQRERFTGYMKQGRKRKY